MATMSQSATRASVAASRSQSREGPAWAGIDEDRRVCEVHSGSAVIAAGPPLHEAALP